MPRRLLHRFIPDPARFRQHRSLRFLGPLLNRPNLWHMNRRSVARAVGVGIFSALMPIPMQMILAAMLAVLFRANLPISVSLVWLTNPVTMPPVFYCTYKLGGWILDLPPRRLPDQLTWEWISREMATLWQPLMLGSVVAGIVLGVLAYALTLLYWRWKVKRQWRRRGSQQDAMRR